MILETYLNENRLLEVNQIEFDKMINENTYYLTEGFTDTIKSICNKVWENIKKVFKKIIEGLKWIKSKTIDKIINFFKSKAVKKKADAEAKKIIAEIEKNDSDNDDGSNNEILLIQNTSSTNTSDTSNNTVKNKKVKVIDYEGLIKEFEENSKQMNEFDPQEFMGAYDEFINTISEEFINMYKDNNLSDDDITDKFFEMKKTIKDEARNMIIEMLELDYEDINLEENKKSYKEKMNNRFNSDKMFNNDNCTIISYEEFKNNYEKINNKINDTMNKYIGILEKDSKAFSLLINKVNDKEKLTKEILDNITNKCKSNNNDIVNKYKSIPRRVNIIAVEFANYLNKVSEAINYKIQVDSSVLLNMKFYKVVEE